MSAAGRFEQFFNRKCLFNSALYAVLLCCLLPAVPVAEADSATTVLSETVQKPSLSELRRHAATIDDVLKTASERVDRLAAAEGSQPRLIEAIRQELLLSRRWNRHLETILLDVAEARRALGERERMAAKEIARMTAVAEEARLELIELKNVLKPRSDEEVKDEQAWSEGRPDDEAAADIGDQIASSMSAGGQVEDVLIGPEGEVFDAQTMLSSMRSAQKSAARDVDAVRAKILEALQTLVSVRGDLAAKGPNSGTDLSSKDITGWAASIATRLERNPGDQAEPPRPADIIQHR